MLIPRTHKGLGRISWSPFKASVYSCCLGGGSRTPVLTDPPPWPLGTEVKRLNSFAHVRHAEERHFYYPPSRGSLCRAEVKPRAEQLGPPQSARWIIPPGLPSAPAPRPTPLCCCFISITGT